LTGPLGSVSESLHGRVIHGKPPEEGTQDRPRTSRISGAPRQGLGAPLLRDLAGRAFHPGAGHERLRRVAVLAVFREMNLLLEPFSFPDPDLWIRDAPSGEKESTAWVVAS
jgi:hypothetical protein